MNRAEDAGSGLTVVIPAYNEAGRIGSTLEAILDYLSRRGLDGEILVVDDGSTDATAETVRRRLGESGPHRLLTGRPNRGKGFSVREGAAAASRPWTLLSDADLSTPIADLEKLMAVARDGDHDLVLGSRGLPDSDVRLRQSWLRQNMGRAFNLVVRLITGLPFKDTQCGFKLWRTAAVQPLLAGLSIDGFAWDVELLYRARRAGLSLAEVPVTWNNAEGSKVAIISDPVRMLRDLLRVRLGR